MNKSIPLHWKKKKHLINSIFLDDWGLLPKSMILKSLFLGLHNIYIDSIHLSSRQVISKGILVGVYKQKQLEIFSYSFNIQWLLTMIHTTDYKHNMVLYLPLGVIIVISFYLVWNEVSAKYMGRHLTGLESQKKSSSGKWTCDDSYGLAGLWVCDMEARMNCWGSVGKELERWGSVCWGKMQAPSLLWTLWRTMEEYWAEEWHACLENCLWQPCGGRRAWKQNQRQSHQRSRRCGPGNSWWEPR